MEKEDIYNIFDKIPDGIIVTDLDFQIMQINQAAIKFCGYKDKNELINKNALLFISKNGLEKSKEDISKTLILNPNEIIKYQLNKKEGIGYDAELTLTLFKDNASSPTGYIIVIKDITESELIKEKIKILSSTENCSYENVIGKSKKMQHVFDIIKHVADKDTTILIEGETGTGKEVVAKIIHNNSKRWDQIFIPINCGALAETLLESELFGYEKGAFTGANTRKYGIFDSADKGTVFLDEINSASLNVQIKLLRFIEAGEFIRVGGTQIIKRDVRILIATNQNLENLIKEKKFREDLYHRINVVKIKIPPLRERKEDIPLLIEYFLNVFNNQYNKNIKLYKPCMEYFTVYPWYGNVRQLKNMVQSLVLLNDSNIIQEKDLPEVILKENILHNTTDFTFKLMRDKYISEFEIKYINNLLDMSKGNVSQAAKISKLSRQALIDKIKAYQINPSIFKKK